MSLLSLLDPSPKRPAFALRVNGQDITTKVENRLISLSITDNSGLSADTFTLTLSDHDGKLDIPPMGAEVLVYLGFDGMPLYAKGRFTINDISHDGTPDSLTLSGQSADLGTTLGGQKTRSFKDLTIGDLVQKIATEHKLTAVLSARYKGLRIGHLDQTSESDLNLLTRLASRHGALCTVKDGKLLFIEESSAKSASGIPLPALKLKREDIASHRYSQTSRDAYTGVKAGYNQKKGGKLEYVLEGTDEKIKQLRQTYTDIAAAKTAAMAELARAKRGEKTLEITLAKAAPDIAAQTPIKISGLKPAINAEKWIASTVTHKLDSGGLGTSISAQLQNQ